MIWKQALENDVSSTVRKWLFKTGSLSAHLQLLGPFTVDVLFEGYWDNAMEKHGNSIFAPYPFQHTTLWVRRVRLMVNAEPVVYASTFLDKKDITGEWKAVAALSSTPLASLVFRQGVLREAFAVSTIPSSHFLITGFSKKALPAVNTPQSDGLAEDYWVRRSVFYKNTSPLVLFECFLPSFWSIDEKD
ncbi:chorismate--pyruvate lyase family protein [Entomobacter blattae]|uniref:chorismate--pyruvate lyase family protein n=1 Tax=Entomobacter blattae TaxID=2762277 RepID=UPI00193B3A82|nr:chorismate lyase [Entomobacter blattae]